jgi:hypothetical protein
MQLIRKASTFIVVGLALAACLGCPFRREEIRIDRDGSVAMKLEYEASLGELDKFDALPTEAGGWRIERTINEEKRAQGDEPKKKEVLLAEQRFAPGATLPRNLAEPDDPEADLVLDFPTKIRLEERPDGTYYYFERTYSPRRWAYAEYWQDVFIDDEVKKLSQKPIDEITQSDREQLIGALATVQAFRQVELAREALADALPHLPAEHGLKARDALLGVYNDESEGFRAGLDRCESVKSDNRDKCFEAEADRLMRDARRAYLESLKATAGLNATQLVSYGQAYARAERYYEITNRLGGHGFEIEVTMPGTVIAHNGEKVRESDGASQRVVFQFDGRAFRDRAHELQAVSRVVRSEE